MILYPLRELLEKICESLPPEINLWLRKPLFECLFCMSSVWGILFTIPIFSFTWHYITMLFALAGFNYIVQLIISHYGPADIEKNGMDM
ncbi:MAG TPA: hypothetical protein PL045_11650 [Chitinophagaceae bacterium]|nr:hypothetical protein [Chitinophagaceae bacterium]